MVPAPDPRLEVGAAVHARASLILSAKSCHRRYGVNAKTKLVNGRVKNVLPREGSARSARSVLVEFSLSSINTVEKVMKASPHLHAGFAQQSYMPPPLAASDEELDSSSSDESTSGTETVLSPVSVTGPVVALDETMMGPPAPQGVHPLANEGADNDVPAGDGPVDDGSVDHDSQPDCEAHGLAWNFTTPGDEILYVNGATPHIQWRAKDSRTHRDFYAGCDTRCDLSPLHYFNLMFPPQQLVLMREQTNEKLLGKGILPITHGELLKFIGILILGTRFEFGERRSLWATESESRRQLVPPPAFGQRTGMPRQRFDDIWSALAFSFQPPMKPAAMSGEEYRWMLVTDFVENFNAYRASNFSPSTCICVDESMSRWYGLGGGWINMGLPHYVSMARKPESGCEIQNSADGDSGIMLQLKLVTSARLEQSRRHPDDGPQLPHGTEVLRQLVIPFAGSDRIVCADSYYASVTTANELLKIGLRHIGVVKTATRMFPSQALGEKELLEKGDYIAMLAKNEDGKSLLAFSWADRDRKSFIATCSHLGPGEHAHRIRWRQPSGNLDAIPERTEIFIPQPKAAEVYYSCCAAIDQHNRVRQSSLDIEKKYRVIDWDKRVNFTILSMILVDAWLAYKACRQQQSDNPAEFFVELAEDLIFNGFDAGPNAGTRQVNQQVFVNGTTTELVKIARYKRKKDGTVTGNRAQGRCKVCSNHTTWICSACSKSTNDPRDEFPVCAPDSKRPCWDQHKSQHHS